MSSPYIFDEFFSSGQEESISPFLTKRSRPWGKHLFLKSAFAGAFFLVLAFVLSFINLPLSSFCLLLVFFLAGTPALIDAINDLKNLQINIDILMTLAAFLALMIDSGMEGALLLVLFEISGALETTVSNKALSALHNLNNLAPKFAHKVREDGTVHEKAVREIEKGMRLFVKVGEIVPLDGKVVEGTTSVNLVHLTGESIPDLMEVGDEIPAGARNLDAGIVIEVTRTSSDSTLTRIIQLILQAQEAKPRLASFLDEFGRIYASSIIALTCLFGVFLPFFSSISYFGTEGSIYRALAFLIAASPCALIIAIPTAYLSAISSSAKKGILLKGGITLDALASCTMVAFDKTGTLTTGELLCVGVDPIGPSSYSKEEALGIAASLERHVVHPIANAIVNFALEQKAPQYEIAKFQSIPGYGLEGFVLNEVPVAIGLLEHIEKRIPPSLLESLRAAVAKESGDAAAKDASSLGSGGQLLAALSIGTSLFLLRFTDQVREEVPLLMKKLKQEHNLRSVMLTGDNEKNAYHVGKLLGITEVFANLRPEDKLAKVASLSESGGLAMIGDGVNDAPALARATVGISMGRVGSATAVDASDVVFLNDDLHLLSWLFSKAHLTRRIVKQNLVLALTVILFATTPALLGWVPLWMAVILHEGGTVLVGLNSLRLLRR